MEGWVFRSMRRRWERMGLEESSAALMPRPVISRVSESVAAESRLPTAFPASPPAFCCSFCFCILFAVAIARFSSSGG